MRSCSPVFLLPCASGHAVIDVIGFQVPITAFIGFRDSAPLHYAQTHWIMNHWRQNTKDKETFTGGNKLLWHTYVQCQKWGGVIELDKAPMGMIPLYLKIRDSSDCLMHQNPIIYARTN